MADSEQPKDKERWPWLATAIFLVVVFGSLILVIWPYFGGWDFWQSVTVNGKGEITAVQQDVSVVIRNLGLLALSLSALIFAAWRSVIANRQAETAADQLDLARRGQETDRFQRAMEMLESKSLGVRVAGLLGLTGVAARNKAEYSKTMTPIIADFISMRSREIPRMQETFGDAQVHELPDDVTEALKLCSHLIRFRQEIGEKRPEIIIDGANFSRCNMPAIDFEGLTYRSCRFGKAEFGLLELAGAKFMDCELKQATFSDAILKNVAFKNCSMEASQFFNSEIINCGLRHSRFKTAHFMRTNFSEVAFDTCELTAAEFEQSTFDQQTTFNHCFFAVKDRDESQWKPPEGLPSKLAKLIKPRL